MLCFGDKSSTHKEDWAPKNWYFQTIVLEKIIEYPLDCKEIKPVNPKGNQPWIFIGRTDAEAPIFWPPDAKSWLIGKEADAGKGWRQEEKGATEDGIDSITDTMDMNLGKLWETVENRGARHAVVRGVAESQTGLSDWITFTLNKTLALPFIYTENKRQEGRGDGELCTFSLYSVHIYVCVYI